MDAINFENHDEVMKLIVKNGELPQYLYKYMSMDIAKLILQTGNVKFSNPADFNDPFDCNITIDTNNSEEEVAKYIDDVTKNKSFTDEQLKQIRENLTDSNKRFIITKNSIREAKKELGVTCFSKKHDNLLMWAHYANKHRGVVFKFDVLQDANFFMTPFHVDYSAKHPVYNYIKDRERIAKLLLETKSFVWQYEDEVRVMKRDAGLYPIRKTALVGIIFGCQVSEEEKTEISKIANEDDWKGIEYLSSKIKQWEFGLNFDKYIHQ